MKVTVQGNLCLVEYEPMPGAIKFSNESIMLYHMNLKLYAQGHDFIKKLMYKDGHMVADTQHYLRARNVKKLNEGDIYAIYDRQYAIRDSAKDYNAGDVVEFGIEYHYD